MSLSARSTTALTVALVAAVAVAVLYALSVTKRTVTCTSAMALAGGAQLQGQMIYHIDFERKVMGSSQGDKPITVTGDIVSWEHSGLTPDRASQITEKGRLDRKTGDLQVQRRLVASNGLVDETVTTGRCKGSA